MSLDRRTFSRPVPPNTPSFGPEGRVAKDASAQAHVETAHPASVGMQSANDDCVQSRASWQTSVPPRTVMGSNRRAHPLSAVHEGLMNDGQGRGMGGSPGSVAGTTLTLLVTRRVS